MPLVQNVSRRAPRRLRRVAYRAQQEGMFRSLRSAQMLVRFLVREPLRPDPELEAERDRRYRKLLADDLENADAGLYPHALLFQLPYRAYLRSTPALLADLPRVIARKRRGDHQDLPADVDVSRYPAYYRRNFHWQTGGYFTADSAERYDLGVELLFLGTADIMRRMAIAPVSRFARAHGPGLRVLDVACGTGNFLRMLGPTLPEASLTGLDLSEAYLAEARRRCRQVPHLDLLQGNAEEMPFRDGWFDVVTSVYLFHELPKDARRNVFAEMHRVLRPGGLLVIEDSAQLSDSGELAQVLANFAREFHEPYYKGYIRDDLAEALTEAGFEVESSEPHLVAKVVVARKPD